jgi:hypothetical protein
MKTWLTNHVSLLIIGLVMVVGLFYWEYSHVSCNARAQAYTNEVSGSISEMNTAYNLEYKICMGKKGF